MEKQLFSHELETWLKSDHPKTLDDLVSVFGERSFAICFLLLMILSALPLPTGGITHVLAVVNIFIAAQMVAWRKTIWLPANWRHKTISQRLIKKAVPFIIRRVRWFEKYTRPRFSFVVENRVFTTFVALSVILFTAFAFIAPPFSGLDTLPSLGVVILALGLLFYDVSIIIAGLVTGIAGVSLILSVGLAVFRLFRLF